MQRITKSTAILLLLLALAGCSMLQDTRSARDIIQTDNELAWLLMEVRPDDPDSAAGYLVGLATHAQVEAEKIVAKNGSKKDAISYYRIAATAFWRSGNREAITTLFDCADEGKKLCAELGNSSPDRDCLFLELVIPLSGVESYFKDFHKTEDALKSIDFHDGTATQKEIKTMNKVHAGLKKQRNLLMQVKGLGNNQRLSNHPGMCKYYLAAGNMIVSRYNDLVSDFFLGHVQSYQEKIGRGEIVGHEDALQLRIDNFPRECGG